MSKLSYLRCLLLKHKQLNIIFRYIYKHTFRPIKTLVKFRYIHISCKRKTNAMFMFGFCAKTRTTCSSKLTKTKPKNKRKNEKRNCFFF